MQDALRYMPEFSFDILLASSTLHMTQLRLQRATERGQPTHQLFEDVRRASNVLLSHLAHERY